MSGKQPVCRLEQLSGGGWGGGMEECERKLFLRSPLFNVIPASPPLKFQTNSIDSEFSIANRILLAVPFGVEIRDNYCDSVPG